MRPPQPASTRAHAHSYARLFPLRPGGQDPFFRASRLMMLVRVQFCKEVLSLNDEQIGRCSLRED